VTTEEQAAVYTHVKGVEEEYMSTDYEMDRVSDRIIICANVDNENTSESSVSC
jgi:hypothetical protein